MPSGYLRQFHERYADKVTLQARVKTARVKDWGSLHERMSRMYRPENPELPTLDPWRNTTPLPAEQFTFVRNPYFHRIDQNGRQLPYIDEATLTIGTHSLIPAKAAAGETDLQARYIRFDNYTFLKDASKRMNFDVKLWKRAEGSWFALMPNLNAIDPVWRDLNRDVRYRRALSVAINRNDINKVIFFGLAKESGNTALPESPLYDAANARDVDAVTTRRWPTACSTRSGWRSATARACACCRDGRRLEFTVETAGESTEETDILDLIKQDLIAVGIKIYPRSTQRDVFRRRIIAGQTIMSAWSGMDNALVASDMEPDALAPTSSSQFNWPRWGQFLETRRARGRGARHAGGAGAGEACYKAWRVSATREQRRAIWQHMLTINAEQLFTIGVVNGTLQPVVVVARRCATCPRRGSTASSPAPSSAATCPTPSGSTPNRAKA